MSRAAWWGWLLLACALGSCADRMRVEQVEQVAVKQDKRAVWLIEGRQRWPSYEMQFRADTVFAESLRVFMGDCVFEEPGGGIVAHFLDGRVTIIRRLCPPGLTIFDYPADSTAAAARATANRVEMIRRLRECDSLRAERGKP